MTSPSYVAFGDSMSIDSYPDRQASQLGVRARGLGAASMLFRNNDQLWPEFTGSDLASRWSGLQFLNVSEDGAVGEDIKLQLRRVRDRDVRLATFTMGGNDLLVAYQFGGGTRRLAQLVEHAAERMAESLGIVRDALPDALFVLTTVYDPTDGTGWLAPFPEKLPLEFLDVMNAQFAALVKSDPRALLADVHRHFLGHGLTVTGDEHWYLPGAPIEPGLQGASEIRRVWWEAVSTSLPGLAGQSSDRDDLR
ncbi:MAG TPA: hypothetical protein VMM17_02410 [Gemmatimonadaceae bacterium]|nr:hypothetical protein [Gemmatimonadaceae bacterium]